MFILGFPGYLPSLISGLRKIIIYIYISHIYIHMYVYSVPSCTAKVGICSGTIGQKKYLPQCQCAMDHGSNSSNRHNTMLMDRHHKPRIFREDLPLQCKSRAKVLLKFNSIAKTTFRSFRSTHPS